MRQSDSLTQCSPDRSRSIGMFRRHFIKYGERAPFGIWSNGNWRTQKSGRITRDLIGKHFAGELALGPRGQATTTFLAVDLDCHRAENDLTDRYWAVRAALAVEPLVFSSPRGLHLYYLLEREYDRSDVLDYGEHCLSAHGLKVRSGQIELYPRGTPFRAPLGPGSRLLDPDTLVPVGSDKQDSILELNRILETRSYQCLHIDPIPTSCDLEYTNSPIRLHRTRKSGPYIERIESRLRDGLTGPGQRNAAMLDLTWYYRAQMGMSVERAALTLWAWLQANHNGYSQTMRNTPLVAQRKCWEAATSFDERKILSRYVRGQQLSGEEAHLYYRARVYADSRGHWTEMGLECPIPSRTLKNWNRYYNPPLRRLMELEVILRGRNHCSQLGRCRTYIFPT